MKRSLMNRCLAITLIVIPLLFASGSVAIAQRNPDKELPLKKIMSLPGKLVSEAKSARPSGVAPVDRLPRRGSAVAEQSNGGTQRSTNGCQQSLASYGQWWPISCSRNARRDLDRRSNCRHRHRERNSVADYCHHIRQFVDTRRRRDLTVVW